MTKPTTHDLTTTARQAGYQVVSAEQPRPNRWVLHLLDGQGAATLVMVQARALLTAADVQDLAELVRLRRPRHSILLAHQGTFSAVAQRTFAELGDQRMRLCTALPPAERPEPSDSRAVIASVEGSA
jgi:hypothetical protein